MGRNKLQKTLDQRIVKAILVDKKSAFHFVAICFQWLHLLPMPVFGFPQPVLRHVLWCLQTRENRQRQVQSGTAERVHDYRNELYDDDIYWLCAE